LNPTSNDLMSAEMTQQEKYKCNEKSENVIFLFPIVRENIL